MSKKRKIFFGRVGSNLHQRAGRSRSERRKILFLELLSRKKYSLGKQLEINPHSGSVLPNAREWHPLHSSKTNQETSFSSAACQAACQAAACDGLEKTLESFPLDGAPFRVARCKCARPRDGHRDKAPARCRG